MPEDNTTERERVRYYMEIMTATMERTIRRLWILALVLVILLVGTNVAWLWYESQFETVLTTETQLDVQQEAQQNSRNIVIGGDWYGDEAERPD